MNPNKPHAPEGLNSYRIRSPYGWVMIAGTDKDDALARAIERVSKSALPCELNPDDLEEWDGQRYSRVVWKS